MMGYIEATRQRTSLKPFARGNSSLSGVVWWRVW